MNAENIFQEVKAHLCSFHMVTHESWISGCVEFFINEGYTLTKIKESAYQQWLMHDLKYVCPGSLPENLAKLDKTMLDGQFVLQIDSVLDISVPAYQQYLKMKKTNMENVTATMNPEENISNKRMLKFQLTDGKQTIAGLEYKTMRKAKTEDILPGCKVMIIGPVQCRQGMLLLTDSAVDFLGGDVQNLLKTQCLAAQLASKLNLPMIENVPGELMDIPNNVNGVILEETSTAAQNSRRQNGTNRQIPRSNPSTSHTDHGTSSKGMELKSLTESYAVTKRQLETENAPEKKIKLDKDLSDYALDDAELEEFEEDTLRAIERCEQLYNSNSPVILQSEPFVYIKQINELSNSQKSGKIFRVKAQIQNVLTKLNMTAHREWNLKCTITDGTGCMDVEVSSDIISKFFGYTPENIIGLKKNVAANPGIKSDINSACVKTSETLRTLYCIMELTMYTLPKITSLIDFDSSHVHLLKERLNREDVTLKLSLR